MLTPSRRTSTTSRWPSSTASRVCPMKPATSLHRNASPSPTPTTSGEFSRAPTTRPGASACTATRVNAPSRRRQTRRMASARSAPAAVNSRPIRCATTSVSVSLASSTPALAQLVAQRGEVLDDAVVHDRDSAGGVEVRVRVGVGGPAVRGPAGVAEPEAGCRQRVQVQFLLQVGELAGLLAAGQFAVGDDGHAGRVVAAVLEAAQPLEDDLEGRLVTHIPNDSAHVSRFLSALCPHSSRRGAPGGAPPTGKTAGRGIDQ